MVTRLPVAALAWSVGARTKTTLSYCRVSARDSVRSSFQAKASSRLSSSRSSRCRSLPLAGGLAKRHLVAWIGGVDALSPYPCSGSCGADILGASEVQHSVQHVGGDRHLGRLSPIRLRTQPVTDDAFPSRDVILHQSTPVVSRHPLPAHAPALGDTSQMSV